MRRLSFSLLLLLIVVTGLAARRAPQREIENVAAFARLYGVVRYFYPGDAAAALDWDRFVVHGVRQTRVALDAQRLETTLTALFQPLGPGIEIATSLPAAPPAAVGDRLVAWRYLGAGMSAPGAGPYRGKRTNRATVAAIDGFVVLMQTLPAQDVRGRTIRLRGQVRATARDATGGAALWLRVDRPNQQMGFFDNMGNRPVREPAWREYSIEGTVGADATEVAFGTMAYGAVTADFDSVELAVREGDGRWTPLPIADAGFESTPDSSSKGWVRAGSSTGAEITRPAEQAPEGRQFLRFSPRATPVSNLELFEVSAPSDAHAYVDLGSGLKARVRLTLTDAEAATSASGLDAIRQSLAQIKESGDSQDVDGRLADIVVAWNVFRHFYPYWSESGVDWDARLRPQLELAYDARTRNAHRDALRTLVADARDGHGSVNDTRAAGARARLPVQLGMIDDQIVITATGAPADAPVGAVVSAIDAVPSRQRVEQSMRLLSGSTQWRQSRALGEIASCAKGAVVTLTVDSGTASRPSQLRCDATQPPPEKRPEAVTELEPGIWYVDLTRAQMAQIRPLLPKLAGATGVVFDVRGYPTDSGAQILPHLIDSPENDRWMHVAKIVGPFGRFDGWESFGWNLRPASPRIAGKVVFLTDGRAISYAESVMGYVADRKLGTIVGATTAGTNGNVATFAVPGGFVIAFTGMRVTRHDGQTPFHLAGVKPDIAAAPTLASLRAGRDDVLARAVSLIRRDPR